LNLIGKTKREPVLLCFLLVFHALLPSIRTKVRNADEAEYDITRHFFSRCFYHKFEGDPSNYDLGFLKSGLLVKVQLLQIFAIFLLKQSRLSDIFSPHLHQHPASPSMMPS
jgi:hypothetical protein